jgi:flagellar assembly factor FliW
MASLLTKYFGLMECDAAAIVEFPMGLPAFEQERNFLIIEQPSMAPLLFLQSVTQPDLCFLTVPVLTLDPEYRLAIVPEDLRRLGFGEDSQPAPGGSLLCLALIAAAENGPPTANLWAPVVINLAARTGLQAIRPDSAYSPEYAFAATRAREGGQPCL